MDSSPRLNLQDISYTYPGGELALEHISMAVHAGQFVGVLGANGSGKTTLLKVMDGLLKTGSGSVTLDGQNMDQLSPRQIYQKVGLVFQNPDAQLFAHSVQEDISFGPLNMGFSRKQIAVRVAYALDAVDMGGFEEKNIGHLSYGQKKRICIAGLLAMGHEMLLLDEPTSGLDPLGEYKMMDLLMALNREKNVTIVMATHSVDLVPVFLHRLFILSHGRLTGGGAPEQVFTCPQEMEKVKLRMPHIAELIWNLKYKHQVPFDHIPLTVGGAQRMLLEKLAHG